MAPHVPVSPQGGPAPSTGVSSSGEAGRWQLSLGKTFCSNELSIRGATYRRGRRPHRAVCVLLSLSPLQRSHRHWRRVKSDQDLPTRRQMQLVHSLRCLRNLSCSPLPGSFGSPWLSPSGGYEVGEIPRRASTLLIIEQIFISHLLCGRHCPRC